MVAVISEKIQFVCKRGMMCGESEHDLMELSKQSELQEVTHISILLTQWTIYI